MTVSPKAPRNDRELLRLSDVSKAFGGVQAVGPLSTTIRTGITGLIGPNGSGKSTTFDLVCGHTSLDSGEVTWMGQAIHDLKPRQIARLGVRRTFQITRNFSEMSVLENMLVGGHAESFDAAVARAYELLEMVGLDAKASDLASELSYGQSKLLELVRLHMGESKLVLLDEPFAGVNRTLASGLREYLTTMHDAGTSYLLIDHEMTMVMSLCSRIIVLDEGKVIADGTPSEIRENDRVAAAYLGTTK